MTKFTIHFISGELFTFEGEVEEYFSEHILYKNVINGKKNYIQVMLSNTLYIESTEL